MNATGDSLRVCFERALALAPAAREPWLASICPDVARRAQILRMLALADSPSDDLLSRPLEAVVEQLSDAPTTTPATEDWIGREIAGVRLCELLGHGGSATVFRGERRQGEVTQIVAVKLLRHALLTQAETRRFRREHAAMARLSHPHIARLHDGGVTAEGTPYLVMEHVDGWRLTEYADRQALDARARVRLLVQACGAVESAHRALIVHRDLKPSNVMVTRDGHVKLLDFGIAKFIDGDDHTEFGANALTPAYAAPEQWRRAPVTTATDVYALGVLLAELLTGARPEAGVDAPQRALARLADGVTAEHQPRGVDARVLRGDLDTIFLKATAPEPERRYASAGALAEDLERFLELRPVRAHPPSMRYRARKFYARHRVASLLAGTLAAGVIAAVATALWQARVATTFAEQARHEARTARATRDFLVDVFRLAEPGGARGAAPTVVDVTDAALARIEHDRSLEPRVRLDLVTQLGSVLRGQSQVDRAIAVLGAAITRGERELGAGDAQVVEAKMRLIEALVTAGQFNEARALVEATRDDASAQSTAQRVDFAGLVATVYGRVGQPAPALAAIAQAQDLCATQACDGTTRLDMLLTRGDVLGMFDRNLDAVTAFEQAMAQAEALHGPWHAKVAAALDGLASAYGRLGRGAEARRVAERVLAIDDAIGVPAEHWQRALHWHRVGTAAYAMGDFTAALEAMERAYAIARVNHGDDDPALATDLRNLGIVAYRLGRLPLAIERLREAADRYAALHGTRHRDVADTRANLAEVIAVSGDTATARRIVDEAIVDLRDAGEGSERQLSEALMHRAVIALIADDPSRAAADAEQARARYAEHAADTRETVRLYVDIVRADALGRLGRDARALPALDAALARLRELDADPRGQAHSALAAAREAFAAGDCAGGARRQAWARDALQRMPYAYEFLRVEDQALTRANATRCPSRDEALVTR